MSSNNEDQNKLDNSTTKDQTFYFDDLDPYFSPKNSSNNISPVITSSNSNNTSILNNDMFSDTFIQPSSPFSSNVDLTNTNSSNTFDFSFPSQQTTTNTNTNLSSGSNDFIDFGFTGNTNAVQTQTSSSKVDDFGDFGEFSNQSSTNKVDDFGDFGEFTKSSEPIDQQPLKETNTEPQLSNNNTFDDFGEFENHTVTPVQPIVQENTSLNNNDDTFGNFENTSNTINNNVGFEDFGSFGDNNINNSIETSIPLQQSNNDIKNDTFGDFDSHTSPTTQPITQETNALKNNDDFGDFDSFGDNNIIETNTQIQQNNSDIKTDTFGDFDYHTSPTTQPMVQETTLKSNDEFGDFGNFGVNNNNNSIETNKETQESRDNDGFDDFTDNTSPIISGTKDDSKVGFGDFENNKIDSDFGTFENEKVNNETVLDKKDEFKNSTPTSTKAEEILFTSTDDVKSSTPNKNETFDQFEGFNLENKAVSNDTPVQQTTEQQPDFDNFTFENKNTIEINSGDNDLFSPTSQQQQQDIRESNTPTSSVLATNNTEFSEQQNISEFDDSSILTSPTSQLGNNIPEQNNLPNNHSDTTHEEKEEDGFGDFSNEDYLSTPTAGVVNLNSDEEEQDNQLYNNINSSSSSSSNIKSKPIIFSESQMESEPVILNSNTTTIVEDQQQNKNDEKTEVGNNSLITDIKMDSVNSEQLISTPVVPISSSSILHLNENFKDSFETPTLDNQDEFGDFGEFGGGTTTNNDEFGGFGDFNQPPPSQPIQVSSNNITISSNQETETKVDQGFGEFDDFKEPTNNGGDDGFGDFGDFNDTTKSNDNDGFGDFGDFNDSTPISNANLQLPPPIMQPPPLTVNNTVTTPKQVKENIERLLSENQCFHSSLNDYKNYIQSTSTDNNNSENDKIKTIEDLLKNSDIEKSIYVKAEQSSFTVPLAPIILKETSIEKQFLQSMNFSAEILAMIKKHEHERINQPLKPNVISSTVYIPSSISNKTPTSTTPPIVSPPTTSTLDISLDGMNVSSPVKQINLGNTDTSTLLGLDSQQKQNPFDQVMSKIPDLSFMLANTLRIPVKPNHRTPTTPFRLDYSK
ncbi:hypothetical protein DLAC_05787 [Tieghemostelium lacteum]|uniref:Uncharacterized protein n=1 Tax=Tieghemostelium lacteum TaxID=361077 RepID=A0A151ZGU7_TIELA|nr:hypothetical protein DLAC_05787 [Tieghemostelium lacteum]|eukprot:KYQ93155.1 hypothetical protein DLAC_05787 [Tieghemostelium lacteum]